MSSIIWATMIFEPSNDTNLTSSIRFWINPLTPSLQAHILNRWHLKYDAIQFYHWRYNRVLAESIPGSALGAALHTDRLPHTAMTTWLFSYTNWQRYNAMLNHQITLKNPSNNLSITQKTSCNALKEIDRNDVQMPDKCRVLQYRVDRKQWWKINIAKTESSAISVWAKGAGLMILF